MLETGTGVPAYRTARADAAALRVRKHGKRTDPRPVARLRDERTGR